MTYQRFKAQGITLPVASSDAALYTLDRVKYRLTQFVKGVLEVHLQDYFQAVLSAQNISIPNNEDGYIVADVSLVDAVPHLNTSNFKFPLLNVWRQNGELVNFTRDNVARMENVIVVELMMPPVKGYAEAAALEPFLHKALALISHKLLVGKDDEVLDGYHWAGEGEDELIESLSIGQYEYRSYRVNRQADAGIGSPTLTIPLTIVEYTTFDETEFETFLGADIHVDSSAEDVEDFADVATEESDL